MLSWRPVIVSALPMRLEPTDATPPLSPVLPYVLLRAAVYMYVSQRGDRCTPSRLRTKPDPVQDDARPDELATLGMGCGARRPSVLVTTAVLAPPITRSLLPRGSTRRLP